MFTRRFASWNNLTYANLHRKDYVDIYTLTDTYENPWPVEVTLDGTDGL
jgi:hypothetical protein